MAARMNEVCSLFRSARDSCSPVGDERSGFGRPQSRRRSASVRYDRPRLQLASPPWIGACAGGDAMLLVFRILCTLAVVGIALLAPSLAWGGVSIRAVVLTGQRLPGAETVVLASSFRGVLTNNSGQVLFTSRLAGPAVDSARDSVLCMATASSFTVIAQEGMQIPGFEPATFGHLDAGLPSDEEGYTLNNSGRFTFLSEITGTESPYPRNLAIWTGTSADDLTLFLRGGDPAPGTEPGTTFGDATFGRSSTQFRLVEAAKAVLRTSDQDSVVFWAFLAGPRGLDYPTFDGWYGSSAVYTASLTGGVTSLVRLIRTGDSVPDVGEVVGPLNVPLFEFAINGEGRMMLQSGTSVDGRVGWDVRPDTVIWQSDPAGNLTLLAATDAPVPGLSPSLGRRIFHHLGINDLGEFVFHSLLSGPGIDSSNDSALWRGSNQSDLALIVREGDPAPGMGAGVVFARSFGGVVSGTGTVVFRSLLRGEGVDETNDLSIWLSRRNGELLCITRTGREAPETQDGALFRSFGVHEVNSSGQVVFSGQLIGGGIERRHVSTGIWLYDPAEGLRLILRKNDIVRVAPGDFRRAGPVGLSHDGSGGEDGRARSLTDAGEILVQVSFRDSAEAIVLARLEDCSGDTVDNTPPIVNVPEDLSIECANNAGGVVDFSATARDNCDPAPVLTYDPSPGTLFAPGTTRVTCKAIDASGNECVGEFDVTVTCPLQLPGDCSQDGALDMADGLCVLGALFLGQPASFPCGDGSFHGEGNLALMDFSGDQEIDLSDAISLLQHLFVTGPAHPLGTDCTPIPGCEEKCNH